MNVYEENIIENAYNFDKGIGANGFVINITKAIVEDENNDAILALLTKIDGYVSNKKINKGTLKYAKELKDSLIKYLGYKKITSICNKKDIAIESEKSLEELLGELNSLIGLDSVKSKVQDLIFYHQVQNKRVEKGLKKANSTLHMAFMGNPGTGKTTVARIIGHIYKQLGLLSKGQFIEVSRTDLIAGYQGQTALKVKKVIERAKGGVLFIDEAYSITENENSDSYGRECLTELTKALEDYRDDLVVIVAGYTKPMELFFNSNPGLKSRFNTFIHFDNFRTDELLKILEKICKDNEYTLAQSLKDKIREYFETKIDISEETFSNGRFVRNLYDELIMNHAKRVVNVKDYDKELLSTLLLQDFKEL